MKRKINNPGRQVRSQEEIDARREARRKYYEEWEAFERELPDFIFADDQTEDAFEHIEETQEPKGAKEPSDKKQDTVLEERTLPVWKQEPVRKHSGVFGRMLDEPEKKAKKKEKTKVQKPAKEPFESEKLPASDSASESSVLESPGKESGPEKKDKSGKDRQTAKKKKSSSARKTKSKKKRRRRRRRNLKPFILAASVAVLVLGGGLFGLHALGVIGGKEIYEVYINDTLVGKVATEEEGRELYLGVRREVASKSDEMVLMKADCDVRKVETLVKIPSKEEEIKQNMEQALEDTVVGTLDKAYTVKINDYIVNLKDKTDVVELLETVKNPYDQEQEYSVQLVADTSRELTSLTTKVVKSEESSNIAGIAEQEDAPSDSSEEETQEEMQEETQEAGEGELPEATGESDGLKQVSFVEDIEIAESYVAEDSITSLEQAVSDITKEKEENKIYEVTAGDCLSIVAEKNNMSVSRLLELNEDLQEDTIIQIGDEIVVTTPEPELSVVTQEEVSYEEDYNAETQYIDNDSWYTTKEVVQQEASAGHRRVTALVTYKNGKETGREIIAQTIITEAVPKIIERGTQTPPTYIKPISGGRYSSGFGKRWGRMHKGVDWACSVGTAVKASCGGTVVSAGWSSGYGYCITIRHPDGRQTRYAHLSKILVSAGKKVKQGEKIALSGNTGRSTGPHLHFEILINGSQVNPLKYLN